MRARSLLLNGQEVDRLPIAVTLGSIIPWEMTARYWREDVVAVHSTLRQGVEKDCRARDGKHGPIKGSPVTRLRGTPRCRPIWEGSTTLAPQPCMDDKTWKQRINDASIGFLPRHPTRGWHSWPADIMIEARQTTRRHHSFVGCPQQV